MSNDLSLECTLQVGDTQNSIHLIFSERVWEDITVECRDKIVEGCLARFFKGISEKWEKK